MYRKKREKVEDDIRFKSITPQIVHLIAKNHKILASAMCRLQEYYESPFPEIKGQIFTLGQLKAQGARDCPGVWTYEGGRHHDTDWGGYNIPSYVLEPFIRGMFDPLTTYEQDIINALKCKQGKFYVIGTYGDKDPGENLDHEICHALYYINDIYREECLRAMAPFMEELKPMKEMLKEWGYCEEVLNDECHAYMSADYDWLIKENKEDFEKFKVKADKELHLKLREIKKRHFKEKEDDKDDSTK